METCIIQDYEILLTGRKDGDARISDHKVYDTYVGVKQTHGTSIYEANNKAPGLDILIEADALVSSCVPCGVYTADCMPIAFLSPNNFAIVHVSWMNLQQGIIQNTVKKLCRQKNNVLDMVVYIGPSIKYYEVGPEFVDKFPGFVSCDGLVHLFDMVGCAIYACVSLGVYSRNIHTHPDCTYKQSEDWYSRRKNKDTGRNFMGVRKLSFMSS